jgi:hypothetical protein
MTSPTRGQTFLFLVLCSVILAAGLAAPRQATGTTTFTYVKIADKDTPIPGGTGNFTFLGQPAVSGGVVAFVGERETSPFQSGIYTRSLDDPVSLAVRYDRNTPVPGSGGALKFGVFSGVMIRDGSVVFRNGVHNGIYSDVGGSLHVVANNTTAIPGGTGTFTPCCPPGRRSGPSA